jgi:hypothetical protein
MYTSAYQQTLSELGSLGYGGYGGYGFNPSSYFGGYSYNNPAQNFINSNYGISSGQGYYGSGSPQSIYNYNESFINGLYGISSGSYLGYGGGNTNSEYNYTQSFINNLYNEFPVYGSYY